MDDAPVMSIVGLTLRWSWVFYALPRTIFLE